MKKEIFYMLIVFSILFCISCSSNNKKSNSGDGTDSTTQSENDTNKDTSTETEHSTNHNNDDTETDTLLDGGTYLDSGIDTEINCVPGTLECICGPSSTCDSPAVCVGNHCRKVAVWGMWNETENGKEMLWWSDQGVWQ